VFKLETVESITLFSEIAPVTPSSHFTTQLRKKVGLAVAIGTEKARSELIIADVLAQRFNAERRIALRTFMAQQPLERIGFSSN